MIDINPSLETIKKSPYEPSILWAVLSVFWDITRGTFKVLWITAKAVAGVLLFLWIFDAILAPRVIVVRK